MRKLELLMLGTGLELSLERWIGFGEAKRSSGASVTGPGLL